MKSFWRIQYPDTIPRGIALSSGSSWRGKEESKHPGMILLMLVCERGCQKRNIQNMSRNLSDKASLSLSLRAL